MSIPFTYKTVSRNFRKAALAGALTAIVLVSAAPAVAQAQGAVGGTAACSVKLIGGILGGVAGVGGGVTAGAVKGAPGVYPVIDAGARLGIGAILPNQYAQTAIQTSNTEADFSSCIVRALSRALIQQMTVSIVNWVNSGFNGSPSFVTNYQQFFTQIADNAVGNFLQGSDLAFLCSPFRLQVKIAVAQAYAQRNASPQCSISKVVNNLDAFINNFSQGGWQGLLSFTTVPTNNPYGAYTDAQIRLTNSIANQQSVKGLDLSLGGGFLSSTEQYDCSADANGNKTNCKTRITTPGRTIAAQLDTTLGTNFRQLELANSFDQILSALINQLVVKTLQGGLYNLSSQNGFNNGNPGDLAGTAASFAKGIDNAISTAEQVRSVLQQNVADIQAVQLKVRELASCWQAFSTSTTATLTESQKAQAAANATSTLAVYQSLSQKAAAYSNSVASVDSAVTTLQNYRSDSLSSLNLQQLQSIVQDYTAHAGSFPNTTALLLAQQSRSQLTTDLAALASDTATKLTECHDFPPTQTP